MNNQKINLIRCIGAALLLATLITQLSAAPLGAAFTYQGKLTSGTNAANGVYDFSFAVFDDPGEGTQQGATFATNTVPVTNGYFLVTLDFGASVFTGEARWLDISVKTNGAGSYTALTPRQQLTPTPYALFAPNAGTAGSANAVAATNISGAISLAQLPAVVLTNNASGVAINGSFTGDGSGLTNVNAANVGGLSTTNLWRLDGNNVASGAFLGATNNQALEFKVNGLRALRLEPTAGGSPNVIAGSPANAVLAGTVGATIAGGGTTNYYGTVHTNLVAADFAAVSGGGGNSILTGSGYSAIGGGADNTVSNTYMYGCSTIGGGEGNRVGNWAGYSMIPGGRSNYVGGVYGFAAGRNAKANHNGTFVWADSLASDFASTTTNQFLIRAGGGVGIGTASPQRTLQVANSSAPAKILIGNDYSAGGYTALDIGVSAISGGYTFLQGVSTAGTNWGDIALNPIWGNVGVGVTNPALKFHVAGDTRLTGVLRSGAETGTTEPPAYGIVVRRINSTNSAAGRILARTDLLTLERDGSYGGLLVRYPAYNSSATNYQTVACMAMDATGTPINSFSVVGGGGIAGTFTVFSSDLAVVQAIITFGNVQGNGHVTQVTIARAFGYQTWVGTLNSSYNQ